MATNERTVVVGLFKDPTRTQQAVAQLSQEGFFQDQIDLTEETAVRTTIKVRAGVRYQEVLHILRNNGAENTHIQIAASVQLHKVHDDHGPYTSNVPLGTHR